LKNKTNQSLDLTVKTPVDPVNVYAHGRSGLTFGRQNIMDKNWLNINLKQAQQELADAMSEIDTMDPDEDYLAQQVLAEVYIKLNYAWNSRNMVDTTGKDQYYELIQYPKEMDNYSGN
jgi:hypothetical protein